MNILIAEDFARNIIGQLLEERNPEYHKQVLKDNAEHLSAVKRLSTGYPQTVGRLLGEIRDATSTPALSTFAEIVGQSRTTVPCMADCISSEYPLPRLPSGLLESLIIPAGYTAAFDTGVWKYASQGKRDVMVAPRLVFPVGQSINEFDGAVHIELCWWSQAAGAWRRRTFPRDRLASKSTIVALSGLDVPVTTSTATSLVNWIDAFMGCNPSLPSSVIQTRQGWSHYDGKPFFIYGTRAFGAPPAGLKVEAPPGMSALMHSLRREGTLEEQLAMMETTAQYPYVMIAMMAALAAPLLNLIDCPSFIVDLGDTTSSGKTTTLMAAGSMWAYTSDRGASLMQTWNTTQVNAERTIAFLGNLPIILNESQLIRNVAEAQTIVHMITEGAGRGRGALHGGLQETAAWKTVVLSSGEATLVERLPGQGVAARCVAIAHRPFGADSKVNQEAADYVRAKCESSFGWIGSIFLSYLMAVEQDWDDIAADYIHRKNEIMKVAVGGIGYRIAQYIAAIDLARTLLIEALHDYDDSIDIDACLMPDSDWTANIYGFMQAARANPAEARFYRMLSYALTVPSRFLGVGGANPPVIDGIMTADMKLFHVSERFVSDYVDRYIGKIEVSAVVRGWVRNGWLLRKGGGYAPYMRQHSGRKVVGWTVSQEAISKLMEGEQ